MIVSLYYLLAICRNYRISSGQQLGHLFVSVQNSLYGADTRARWKLANISGTLAAAYDQKDIVTGSGTTEMFMDAIEMQIFIYEATDELHYAKTVVCHVNFRSSADASMTDDARDIARRLLQCSQLSKFRLCWDSITIEFFGTDLSQ